jgi:DNA-directed RNA polymerase subunit RPC12/RpoP
LDQVLLTRDENFDVEAASEGKAISIPTDVTPFEQIEFAECQKLIRYALDISTEARVEIPWEFQYWQAILGDLSKVPKMAGSLYKCPKCGEDLPQSAVDLIKQHVQSDDIQFYILCRKCGGEFD